MTNTYPGLPKTIKLGIHTVTIKVTDPHDDRQRRLDNAYGVSDWDGLTILLESGLQLSFARQVLLHEIMHMIRFANSPLPIGVANPKSWKFHDWEHYFINLWDGQILSVLKDNLELKKFLLPDSNTEETPTPKKRKTS